MNTKRSPREESPEMSTVLQYDRNLRFGTINVTRLGTVYFKLHSDFARKS